MGCIFSHCKNRNEYDETLLINKKYCFQCSKMLTQKKYDKHIKKCRKNYLNRMNL